MENEIPMDKREKSVRKETKGQPTSIRSSKKTILLAVVISVITIGSLAILRSQVDTPQKDATAVGHSVTALKKTMVGSIGAEIDGTTPDRKLQQTGSVTKVIERSIESLSERISQWFDSIKADHSSVKKELSGLANSMNAIHESVAELRKGKEDLKQRIDAAQSRLQIIARDVHAHKIAAKKQASKQRKRVAGKPPFHIDAIDLWDDAVYVAVSQDSHVAFLREGEQQSGWIVTNIDRIKGQVAFRGPVRQDYTVTLRS